MRVITILCEKVKKDINNLKKGFSLIELIISMVILGFVLMSLIKVFSDLTVTSVQPDYRYTQSMLGQELLEEIRSKRFDELEYKDANGNWSTSMGVDAGETAGNKSTFDDVDDFNSFSETLSSPFSGFLRSVTVGYIATGNLDTVLTIPSPITSDWTPSYKKVSVVISNNAVPALTLNTVISTAKSRDKV